MEDIDDLLAMMGGEEPPPRKAAAPPQRLRPGRAGPAGRQQLMAAAHATELWNPSLRWNPAASAAVAPIAALRPPSAHLELARQKAVRALQARFKQQCDVLNTGWSEPEVNKHFECWMLDSSIRKAAAGDGGDGGGGGGGGGGGNDPLLPPPKMAGDDPGLKKELFASAKLQRKAVQRFMSDMQKAVAKAHRTLVQLGNAGSQKRYVKVTPAIEPEQQVAMVGWDGKAMLNIKYGGTSFMINQCHWDKLAQMLRLELGDDQAAAAGDHTAKLGPQGGRAKGAGATEQDIFKDRVFCLLVRYNSLQGGGVHGGGFQAAIPNLVFDALLEYFDVYFECFASPLNARYPHFCSAFPDTDSPFGSIGSFFSFNPTEGSFEANPPFVPNLMLKMAEHMHMLLTKADEDDDQKALCFVVIIPSWEHTMGWRALLKSPYCRHHMRLLQRKHGYTEGAQHCRRSRYRISVGDTSVFFLQSKSAMKRWPVTETALEAVTEGFSSKHNNDNPEPAQPQDYAAVSGEPQEGEGGDRDITCRDCSEPFVFTVQAQAHHAAQEWIDPVRCQACKKATRERVAAHKEGWTTTAGEEVAEEADETDTPSPAEGQDEEEEGATKKKKKKKKRSAEDDGAERQQMKKRKHIDMGDAGTQNKKKKKNKKKGIQVDEGV